MKEIWKPWFYEGRPTRYEISNMGQIHDLKTDKYTYGNETREGYFNYTMYLDDGRAVSKLVHRLVAEIFVPNPDESYDVVDHINAIRADNRASNLRWCTAAMNTQYAVEKGAMAKEKGEKSPRHKYTKKQIQYAIELLKTGKYKSREIADLAGIHIHTVGDLRRGIIWTDELDGSTLSVVDGVKKFTDEQIMKVITMLTGEYTVKEIHDITGVSKADIRGICDRKIYKDLTKDIPNLSYKVISKRASMNDIMKAIKMLETLEYSCKEIQKKTGLSRSVIEKLAYHQRWPNLTAGKKLGFKNSKSVI